MHTDPKIDDVPITNANDREPVPCPRCEGVRDNRFCPGCEGEGVVERWVRATMITGQVP